MNVNAGLEFELPYYRCIQYICKYKFRWTLLFQDTNGLLISDIGRWRHKERDSIFTMLTPPQRAVNLVTFKISVSRDAMCPTTPFHGQNPTFVSIFSKFSNSQDNLFWAWRHPHSSSISCLVVYYDKFVSSYPLRASVAAPNDYAPGFKLFEQFKALPNWMIIYN